ncbi:ribosomal-protein-alanine N-acetyltransferase [Litorimonas taeanensis]|uniref:Ribosomal-protein-alanine N-acetyltransferase n=1 Tax=Litorimonas taeanensis TaxID=568099 RepID=A0A420WEA4_9PROT|nr:GNAT family protein [Litorimonas taeanensis]RKQ69265.1 ribosomal-protein-alanine N-acetyltransferase [Litorimonas taeanensis]
MPQASIHTLLKVHASGGALTLRHPRWADYESWSHLRRDNKEWLAPWEPGWSDSHITRITYRTHLSRYKKFVQTGKAYPFHVFYGVDETLIGACNLSHIERGSAQSARLGYWIGEKFARNGFARSSVEAVTRFGFETLGLHRIEAAVQPENLASISVLESQNFTREGISRGYLKIDKVWRDHVIFAKLSSD